MSTPVGVAFVLTKAGRDVFPRGVQTVRERTALDLRPEASPDIVGTAAKQQIEAFALCLGDGLCPGRRARSRHPVRCVRRS